MLTTDYWKELGDAGIDEKTQAFADNLVTGTLKELETIDDRIRTRAEHWRIERMAIVDRNVLRLAVYEFLFEDTPHTVVINEALEIARRFSTFEAPNLSTAFWMRSSTTSKKSPQSLHRPRLREFRPPPEMNDLKDQFLQRSITGLRDLAARISQPDDPQRG